MMSARALVPALALCAAFGVPVALVAVYRVDGAHPQAMLGGLVLPPSSGAGPSCCQRVACRSACDAVQS